MCLQQIKKNCRQSELRLVRLYSGLVSSCYLALYIVCYCTFLPFRWKPLRHPVYFSMSIRQTWTYRIITLSLVYVKFFYRRGNISALSWLCFPTLLSFLTAAWLHPLETFLFMLLLHFSLLGFPYSDSSVVTFYWWVCLPVFCSLRNHTITNNQVLMILSDITILCGLSILYSIRFK